VKLIILVGIGLLINFAQAIEVDSNLVVNNAPFYSRMTNQHRLELEKVEPKWIDYIKYYRSFYIEGENLNFYCKQNPKVYYKDRWERERVINSFISTLQMLILEHTIPAMAAYSKELDFSDAEFEGLYENAINSSCSENISVMSHRRIRKLFKDSFKKESPYQLPSVKENPLFTKKISLKQSKEERLVRELTYTLGLFKAACSWGQRFESLRLLEKLVKNEVVASYVIRQINSIRLKRDKGQGLEMLERYNDSTKVLCDGLICRKRKYNDFQREFPKGIGSNSYYDDMRAIYCEEIQNHKSEAEPQLDNQIKELVKEYEGNESLRLVSQFIALITKTPDFNIWTQNKATLVGYLKSGMEYFWDTWAQDTLNERVGALSYEEPLVLKVVDHYLFAEQYRFDPRVVLDLNSGEFDEEISINGKIRFRFYIEMPKNDAKWFFFQYRIDEKENADVISVNKRLKYYVDHSYEKFKDKLSNYIIKGDISDLIVKELKTQFLYFKTIDMEHIPGRVVNIPVDINVSPFALIYLKNKNLMRYYNERELNREKSFELENRIDSMAEKSKK
jgi:hypothetical protein